MLFYSTFQGMPLVTVAYLCNTHLPTKHQEPTANYPTEPFHFSLRTDIKYAFIKTQYSSLFSAVRHQGLTEYRVIFLKLYFPLECQNCPVALTAEHKPSAFESTALWYGTYVPKKDKSHEEVWGLT